MQGIKRNSASKMGYILFPTDSLVFPNEDVFIQLDELDKISGASSKYNLKLSTTAVSSVV